MRKRAKEDYATGSANKTWAMRKNNPSNAKKTKISRKTVQWESTKYDTFNKESPGKG